MYVFYSVRKYLRLIQRNDFVTIAANRTDCGGLLSWSIMREENDHQGKQVKYRCAVWGRAL